MASEGLATPAECVIFLLEDNPDRLARMLDAIACELPGHGVHVEDDCEAAVA